MNLLIVNGYDKNGWGKLARYGLQPICEFYRDQLKIINTKIKTTFIYPSMNLDENYDESFIKSFPVLLTIIKLAPASASASAHALPKPFPAPVTSAILFLRLYFFRYIFLNKRFYISIY